ncbi:MAG: MAPEG family protein [Parvularculaceae bacterium]|nr:MAPEG family protein [Parvularculaceae bacterium]
MTPTAFALLGFVAWTILLVLLLASYRISLVATGKRASPNFNADGDDVDGFGRRITRAHANCYENLPLVGAILLYAIATNQSVVTDPLAPAFLGARMLQSATHIASTSRNAILVRLFFYSVQIAILVFWILKLTHLI